MPGIVHFSKKISFPTTENNRSPLKIISFNVTMKFFVDTAGVGRDL